MLRPNKETNYKQYTPIALCYGHFVYCKAYIKITFLLKKDNAPHNKAI